MTRSKLFKSSLIVMTVMLWYSFPGLTQSLKSTEMNITTISKAQQTNKKNATEERIYHKELAKYNCSCDMHLKLIQSKTELESGIASKRLAPEQIKQLKDRVTSLETRLNTSGCQSKNNSTSHDNAFNSNQRQSENRTISNSPAENSRNSSSSEYSREQFKNLSVQQQRQLLTSPRELIITDLVNATPEMLNNRVENIIYIPASHFRNADAMRKLTILNNPNYYVVVSDNTQLPKSKISQSQLDALPAAKRNAILESGQYEITN